MDGKNIEIVKVKAPAPRVTLKEDTILAMEIISEQRKKLRSEIYQEALDLYISIYRFMPHKNEFKEFINKIL